MNEEKLITIARSSLIPTRVSSFNKEKFNSLKNEIEKNGVFGDIESMKIEEVEKDVFSLEMEIYHYPINRVPKIKFLITECSYISDSDNFDFYIIKCKILVVFKTMEELEKSFIFTNPTEAIKIAFLDIIEITKSKEQI